MIIAMAPARTSPHPSLDARHREQRCLETPGPWVTDRPGYLLHLAFAWCACICLAGPTSVVEVGAAPLFVTTGLRLIRTWRTTLDLLAQPHMLWFLAWACYSVLSLAWSPDPGRWETDLNALRWVLFPIALWPVVHHRRALLVAIAAGIIISIGAQLVHLMEVRTGARLLGFDRAPGRISAWHDPVAGASVLVGGLGLWLPTIISKRRLVQIVGVVGSGLVLVGIVLTGTRGAWIASALLLGLSGGVCLLLAPVRARLVRRLPIVLVAGVALLVGAWIFAGDGLRDRFDRGVDEVARAIEHQDYASDTGARIAMWQQASRGFAHAPVFGLGSGGYGPWASADAEARGIEASIHTHAHGLVPHLLATHGLVGSALFGGFVFASLRAAARTRSHLALALVGLLLAGLFDTVQVNMQTAALAAALIGLSPARAPSDTR